MKIKNLVILLVIILFGCEFTETTSVIEPIDDSIEVSESLEVRVHYIDVGQGDSTLIEVDDYHILIDAGHNHVGDEVVEYLNKVGVDDIEILVGTHPDADHIGGLDIVLENFDVELVIDSCKTHTTITWDDYMNAIDNEKETGMEFLCDANLEYKIADGIVFEVLEAGDDFKDNNAQSVVTKLTAYGVVYLFTSDAETMVEEILLKYDLDADIYKAGHHGSRTSSSSKFLEAVSPQVVVISAGIDNKYGHPHEEALSRIMEYTSDIYGTWLSGSIIISSNSEGYYFDSYEKVTLSEEVVVNDYDYQIPTEVKSEKGVNKTLDLVMKPDTEYSIEVVYKSGPSSASGLENKVSDSEGNISWTWKVSSNIASGTWKIIIKEINSSQEFEIDFIVD